MTQPSHPLDLIPTGTALVLIDLQHGILGMPVAPHASAEVLQRAVVLVQAAREVGVMVVLVRVAFAADGADVLQQRRDNNYAAARTAGWDTLAAELEPAEADLIVTKHQWGAFYGTELELQLRRRGIDTLILGGISTNFGVESTARDAFERGFSLVFAEDVMASASADAHRFACETIFPRLGRVRTCDVIREALGRAAR